MFEILRSWLTYLYQKMNIIAISGCLSFDLSVNKKTQPFGWVSFSKPALPRKLLLSGFLTITSESLDSSGLLVRFAGSENPCFFSYL